MFTSSESSPVMTKEEKRQVVKNFVQKVLKYNLLKVCMSQEKTFFAVQYLEDNPEARTDARLLDGLNTMAANLVERTFDDKASSSVS